jgi:alpha-glucosidase
LRFWFDRGVDGFRIDVAHALYKDELLRDNPDDDSPVYHGFMYDQEEVHDVYRNWRKVADSYAGDRVLVGEVYLFDPERSARFVATEELHLAFNFLLVWVTWEASAFKDAIQRPLEALARVGASASWVLSNHDVERHVTRFGGGEVGLRRGRAAALLLLALPGASFLYQGEELGLEQADVPDDRRQDPVFRRTGGALKGRDGCRVPIPWDDRPPGYGFSKVEGWLPAPEGWGARSVATLKEDSGSILHLYRTALEIRKSTDALMRGSLAWIDAPAGYLGFSRKASETVICITNFTSQTHSIPMNGKVLLSSNPEVELGGGTLDLPADTCVWIRQ